MQKNSSLGKGLAELLGDKSFSFFEEGANTTKIIEISIDAIEPSPYQPRKKFDNDLLSELSSSIKSKGVLQPILVRESSTSNYEIIAGERRIRAARIAQLETIPCIVLNITDEDAMEIALIENIQRQQLSPIEEARAIAKLINDLNYTHEKLSLKIGKSRSHITNMLRLLNLPSNIQILLDQEKITIGHARALINMDSPELLVDKIINENLTVRDTESLAKNIKLSKIDKSNILDKFKKEKRLYLDEIKEQIQEIVQLKTKLRHNGKKGVIEITFNNINELELFMKKIN
ncbi:MAG: ParB/RepB/Spo0J family partition protein [Rickettsiales bacterium]|jgi:ParB family transcriptional regulator, chromosome partitioning protein|nr:ParB/RepB/Spo0J family partition protein [Rickettsiales bacterium]